MTTTAQSDDSQKPDMTPAAQAAFDAFPAAARHGCLALREIILTTAATMPEVGRISEELRWGQPAYLTPETKSGTTIRLGVPKSGGYALFVHCQTTLIEDFRPLAPPTMRFDGNRAVLFDEGEIPDADLIGLLVRAALTYHLK